MVSGVNRVGIPSISRMRTNALKKTHAYDNVYNSRNRGLNSNNRNLINGGYDERMRFLNDMFGLNAVRVTRNGRDEKISKGVEVLSISEDGDKRLQDKVLNLKVLQVAEPQRNSSKELFSKSKDIEPGEYQFQITSKDKKNIAKIQVKDGQTNEEVLNNISSNVNSLNCGVKAEVVKNKVGGVTLNFTSTDTGVNGIFKVQDFKSDLASKLKLNSVSQNVQNALYSLNDRVYESVKNEISVENNLVKLKLNSEGSFNIDINKKRCYEDIQSNSNEIASNLDFLVNHYNNKIGNTPRNTFTYEKLTNEIRVRSNKFNNVGIETLENNTMRFEDRHFRELARANPQLLMSSMNGSNGVLNYFNMVRASDLHRQSSVYGARGNNIGVFSRGSLLNY